MLTGQTVGLDPAKNNNNNNNNNYGDECGENTKNGSLTVQLKPGRTTVNHHPRGREKSKINLVKSIRKKSTLELTAVFNSEIKSISTQTMQRELKGSSLTSCVVSRKTLLTEESREKTLQCAPEHQDWTLEGRTTVVWFWWVQI